MQFTLDSVAFSQQWALRRGESSWWFAQGRWVNGGGNAKPDRRTLLPTPQRREGGHDTRSRQVFRLKGLKSPVQPSHSGGVLSPRSLRRGKRPRTVALGPARRAPAGSDRRGVCPSDCSRRPRRSPSYGGASAVELVCAGARMNLPRVFFDTERTVCGAPTLAAPRFPFQPGPSPHRSDALKSPGTMSKGSVAGGLEGGKGEKRDEWRARWWFGRGKWERGTGGGGCREGGKVSTIGASAAKCWFWGDLSRSCEICCDHAENCCDLRGRLGAVSWSRWGRRGGLGRNWVGTDLE